MEVFQRCRIVSKTISLKIAKTTTEKRESARGAHLVVPLKRKRGRVYKAEGSVPETRAWRLWGLTGLHHSIFSNNLVTSRKPSLLRALEQTNRPAKFSLVKIEIESFFLNFFRSDITPLPLVSRRLEPDETFATFHLSPGGLDVPLLCSLPDIQQKQFQSWQSGLRQIRISQLSASTPKGMERMTGKPPSWNTRGTGKWIFSTHNCGSFTYDQDA